MLFHQDGGFEGAKMKIGQHDFRGGSTPSRGVRAAVARVVAATAGIALTMTGLAWVPAAAEPLNSPSSPAGSSTAPTRAQVTLPTGDHVTVERSNGRLSATVAKPSTAYVTIGHGADLYVIPGPALHDIGTRDQYSAFDVASLAGMRPTPPAATPATPGFRMFELNVKGISALGAPDTGDTVIVSSVDDSRKFFGMQSFYRGGCSFSVPAGVYQATGVFLSFGPSGPSSPSAVFQLVMLAQFTVSGNGSVTVDARAATVDPTATPPFRSSLAYYQVTADRQAAGPVTDGTAPQFSTGIASSEAGTVLVSPTAPVTVGTVHYTTSWRFSTEHGPSGGPSIADVEWSADGTIPAAQAFRPSWSSLAEIHTTYGDDNSSKPPVAFEGRYSFLPWEAFSFSTLLPLPIPEQRSEYVTALPTLLWGQTVIGDELGNDFYASNLTAFDPGTQASTEWFGQPQVPGFSQGATGAVSLCPVCRQGNTLLVDAYPFVDPSGHLGFPDFPSAGLTERLSTTLYANGTLVKQSADVGGLFHLPPGPDSLRIDVATQRQAAWSPLSTSTRTSWTVPAAAQTATLPSGFVCLSGSKNCHPVPLVTVGYGLPLDSSGDLVTGRATATLTFAHTAGSPLVPMASVAVKVSTDGGSTWSAARVYPGSDGVDLVSYTTPPVAHTDGYLDLMVSATDAAGSAVTQSILRAARLVDPPTGSPLATGAAVSGAVAQGTLATGAGVSAATTACAAPTRPDTARCMAVIAGPASGTRGFAGYGATDLESAYALPIGSGAGQNVAIVDAYRDPNAESDLAVYRARYGLPACSTANHCFSEVNQSGGSHLPAADPGWAVEESLDLDMVSAACPRCRILLVVGNSASISTLGTAVDTAATMGAVAISNSYGTEEFAAEARFASHYDHPGHAITVSAGDFGFGPANFPANLTSVTSVGGTTLTPAPATSRGWAERAWNEGASGCSAYVAKPSWQHDALCPMRTVADVSAVANLATGVAVYDTYQQPGWIVAGGTSVASPLVAGVYALAKNTAGVNDASRLYTHGADLNDVAGGSNGYCGGDYLCTARSGYDGPTGLGSPNGDGAF